MKVCPYCMRAHSRPNLAVYCSAECSKRAARQNARANGKLRRLMAKDAKRRQQLALDSKRWRETSSGRKSLEQLVAEVFGVSEIPPMKDTAA